MRRINQLVKTRSHCVHSELLSVLLALPIRNVNLDKEKEDILKSKKFMTRKQKLLAMSKKERKVRFHYYLYSVVCTILL